MFVNQRKHDRKSRTKKIVRAVSSMAKQRYAPQGQVQLSRVLQDINRIKQVINVETRMFDSVFNTVNSASGVDVLDLGLIAQGDDFDNRSGNSIKMQRLNVRFYCTQNGAAVNTIVRLILTLDRQRLTTVNIPGPSDLLEYGSLATLQYISPFNHSEEDDGSRRFTILVDVCFPLVSVSKTNAYYETDIPLSQHLYFNGTTGTTASAGEMYPQAWIITNEGTNRPTSQLRTRIYYTDN